MLTLAVNGTTTESNNNKKGSDDDGTVVDNDDHWYQVCTQANVRSLPFCDTALDLEQRVTDYVERVVPTESVKST